MKTKFQGNPLIEVSEHFPSTNFLKGEFGKEFFKEYERKVKRDYGDNPLLKVLSYDDDCRKKIVTGSNPFAVVLANQILSQQGLRTANLADLERIIRMNALDLRKTSIDVALVLISEDCKKDENKYLARKLMKQIKERNPKLELPIMINLTDLELTRDENSEYGLAFKLKEDANLIYAPILNKQGRYDPEDIDKKTGLPKQIKKNGKRTFRTYYKTAYSLYELSLHWGFTLSEGWDLGLIVDPWLEGSFFELDRIVVINDGVMPPEFFEKLAKIIRKYQKQK